MFIDIPVAFRWAKVAFARVNPRERREGGDKRVKGPPGGKSEGEGGTLIDRDAEEGRFFHLGFHPRPPLGYSFIRYKRGSSRRRNRRTIDRGIRNLPNEYRANRCESIPFTQQTPIVRGIVLRYVRMVARFNRLRLPIDDYNDSNSIPTVSIPL